jgi:hypothetical protein
MAVNSTFYLNAATLSLATSVYLDTSLLLIAPDGYYGDGTVIRQQSSGILINSTPDLCSAPCGPNISAPGVQGLYLASVNLGDTLGAVIVKFFVINVPDGFRAIYNGTTYNKLSSNIDGLHQSTTPGNFTVVGDTASTGTCSSSWYPAGGSLVLNEYVYDGTFVATGNTPSTTIAIGDISLTTGSPELCVMVIPKLAASPNLINFEVFGGCTSTGWDVEVECPASLPSFSTSVSFPTGTIPCSTTIDQTCYFAKVHLAIDSYVGLYDYVFTDANGQFPLADGFYLTNNVAAPNKVIRVTNGLITGITNCV